MKLRVRANAIPDMSSVVKGLRNSFQIEDFVVEVRALLQIAHVHRRVVELWACVTSASLAPDKRRHSSGKQQDEDDPFHAGHFTTSRPSESRSNRRRAKAAFDPNRSRQRA